MKQTLITGLVLGSLVGGTGATDVFAAQAKKSPSRSGSSGTTTPAASGGASSAAAAAKADEDRGSKGPKDFEHAGTRMKVTAPGNWKPWEGGSMSDSTPFGFSIQPEPGALRALAKQADAKGANPNEPIKYFGDNVTVETTPLPDPDAKADALVAALKETIKRTDPQAEFKAAAEKVKVDGMDAAALTVTLPGQDKEEAKRIERHVLFARDGRQFDVMLKSHVNTAGKQFNPFQAFVRSIKFTAPAETGEALLKTYEDGQKTAAFAAPKALTSGVPCHHLACTGSFVTVVFPDDRRALHAMIERDGKPPTLYSDGVTGAVAPAKSPTATLDSAVEDIQAEAKAAFPSTEFKPLKKTKLAGADAVELVSTSDGEAKDKEAQRVQRRIIAVRDGKVYQMIHFAHADTAEQQTPAFERIASTFRFTTAAPAAPAASAAIADAPAAKPAAAGGKAEGDGLE
jgi:hypothetical protein